MLRAAVLLALVSVAAAVAAPVPPSEKELIARHWGKTEGQGEFALAGKRLTIRTAVPPDMGLISVINGGRTTAPRATRAVAGDFEAAVTVTDAALPGKDAKHTDAYPNTRAGLFIEGGGYAVEFHLYQHYPKFNGVAQDQANRCVWVDTWFPGGGSGNQLKVAEAGKSTHLRLARKDKAIAVSYSFDGKEWSAPYTPRKDMAFPDDVTIGVFLSHSTYQTLDATFDAFTVEKPKEKAKKE